MRVVRACVAKLYAPLGKLVVTMDVKKKHVLLGNERVYDQELIYARVIGLLVSSRDIKFADVLAYELAAYPPSMFNLQGEMKIAKSKIDPETYTTSDCFRTYLSHPRHRDL